MTFAESVFYYWSDKEWESCDRFKEFASIVLNKQASPGLLEWSASDTQACHLLMPLCLLPMTTESDLHGDVVHGGRRGAIVTRLFGLDRCTSGAARTPPRT
jgi:hypothetical protein